MSFICSSIAMAQDVIVKKDGSTILAKVTFPGQKPQKDFHRHLTTLQPCQVPNDAESIYYATCFAATRMHIPTKAAGAFRYLRLPDCPFRLTEVFGVRNGQSVDRSKWHACNLFRTYGQGGCQAAQVWKGQFHLDEALEGSYLCIAVNGEHGAEGAWAGLKVEGKYIGCPDRAPSYKCNPWEFQSGNSEKNYTFYIPITADLIGKDLEAWTLTFNDQQVKPEVWITAYPIPFQQKELHLQRK